MRCLLRSYPYFFFSFFWSQADISVFLPPFLVLISPGHLLLTPLTCLTVCCHLHRMGDISVSAVFISVLCLHLRVCGHCWYEMLFLLQERDRSQSFRAIGVIAFAVRGKINQYLDSIVQAIKQSLPTKESVSNSKYVNSSSWSKNENCFMTVPVVLFWKAGFICYQLLSTLLFRTAVRCTCCWSHSDKLPEVRHSAMCLCRISSLGNILSRQAPQSETQHLYPWQKPIQVE